MSSDYDRIMLRRPGDKYKVYIGPDFTEPKTNWPFAEEDPRYGEGALDDYSLSLPHSCQEWVIGGGDRAQVLMDAMALREQLDQVIAVLSAE